MVNYLPTVGITVFGEVPKNITMPTTSQNRFITKGDQSCLYTL